MSRYYLTPMYGMSAMEVDTPMNTMHVTSTYIAIPLRMSIFFSALCDEHSECCFINTNYCAVNTAL